MADSLVYNSTKQTLLGKSGYGTLDADTDTFNIMLVTATYTALSDATKLAHRYRSDIANEVASGGGYTTGGQALAGPAITLSTNTVLWDFTTDPVWATASFTSTGAIVYKVVGSAATDILVSYNDFGGSYTASGGNFLVTLNANGIVTIA